jgi:hypothetical protein
MGEPSRFEVGPQRNRWVAVALSIVMPGSGRLYLGRYHRVAIWLWPTVVFAILVFISSRTGISSLAGAATTAEALGGLLVVSILVALWRLAAAVAAFLIVGPRSGGGAHGLTSGACWKHGGAVEGSALRTFLSLWHPIFSPPPHRSIPMTSRPSGPCAGTGGLIGTDSLGQSPKSAAFAQRTNE